MSTFAEEVLEQLNKLRRWPQSFVPILEDHLRYFEGNALFLPNSKLGGIETEEGPQAVSEEFHGFSTKKQLNF